MNLDHKKRILKNLDVLIKKTDVEALLPKLLEKGVFLPKMLPKYQLIKFKNAEEMNLKRELYFEVLTRGPAAFKNLVSALCESQHAELAALLEPEENVPSLTTLQRIHPFQTPKYLLDSKAAKIMKQYAESHPGCLINLGTTPLTIKVKKATKEMDASTTYKTAIYPMVSRPKGYAMIINIKKYSDGLKTDRVGAEHDESNLKTLFEELGYTVLLHENLTKEEMTKKLKIFSKLEAHSHVDSCILAILSHGEQVRGESNFVAADGIPISESSVLDLFSNEKCIALRKKPKIFFFQCCRGDGKVHGIKQDFSRTRTDGMSHVRLRAYSDMLIAYSTVSGYESHRDLYLGTWFIQAVCEVFMQHACDTEIMEMLKLVDSKLENLVSEVQTMQTTCFENRGFKTFFFNPGIYYDAKNKSL